MNSALIASTFFLFNSNMCHVRSFCIFFSSNYLLFTSWQHIDDRIISHIITYITPILQHNRWRYKKNEIQMWSSIFFLILIALIEFFFFVLNLLVS